MQAMIMAAGKGSRLGKITEGKPKSFAEIKGKKLIEYNLQLLKKYGINEIFIVIGYCCEAFEKLTEDMEDVHLIYNPFYEMMNVLGSFYMGMDYLKDDFVYLHADTLCEPLIFERLVYMPLDADAVLPVDFSPCNEEAMKVKTREGSIVKITKQMPVEEAEGEFIGMAAFRKELLPALRAKTKSLLQEKKFSEYFESAVQRLIDEEHYRIKAVSTAGAFWTEIDFAEDYEKAAACIPESLTGIFL